MKNLKRDQIPKNIFDKMFKTQQIPNNCNENGLNNKDNLERIRKKELGDPRSNFGVGLDLYNRIRTSSPKPLLLAKVELPCDSDHNL
ncbi:hypothetical protein BpHYR1_050248 [Brachionus plicatilis]|uniref:Uncharacterized protein n=1 Tax=Brachionus plicatilis TaxID=10195 RepID=A0A3M7RJH2_BRAPC|nr:hypothetical protein BpHYR1_050248 [Brachionus plicatilis]